MKHTCSTSDLGYLKFNKRREMMGWNTVERNWKELKGKLKETWGDMTDDELDIIAGKREQLVGKIQTKYEIAREEAERQVNAFAHDCDAAKEPLKNVGEAVSSRQKSVKKRSLYT